MINVTQKSNEVKFEELPIGAHFIIHDKAFLLRQKVSETEHVFIDGDDGYISKPLYLNPVQTVLRVNVKSVNIEVEVI